jgi:hypothetical protein
MPLVDDPDVREQRAEFAQKQGEYWTKVHADAYAKLAEGTTIIINVVTGEYITGTDRCATRDAHEQRFGKGKTISWSFDKDRPIFVGGGLWRS